MAVPGGLQHRPQLYKLEAQRSCYNTVEWLERYQGKDINGEEGLIKGVFQNATDALPTCPKFIFEDEWVFR